MIDGMTVRVTDYGKRMMGDGGTRVTDYGRRMMGDGSTRVTDCGKQGVIRA